MAKNVLKFPGCRNIVQTFSIVFLGLFILIVGFGLWDLLPPGPIRVIVGGGVILLGGLLALYGFFQGADAELTEEELAAVGLSPDEGHDETGGSDDLPDIESIWTLHREELANVPDMQRRVEILQVWRNSIDERAHDYADMIASARDLRDELTQMEVQTFMHAYFVGYMAGREWIPTMAARDEAFLAGRSLRDGVRELGLPLDELAASLGVVMNETLHAIVDLGLEDGGAVEDTAT